jgi:prepilin-type N-terminal cleavage/methylation domain-containing protein
MNSKGFTLIELLVVVAIIGILAAVGVVAYNGYTNAAKVSALKANHKNVVNYMSARIKECELGASQFKLKTTNGTNQNIACSKVNVSTYDMIGYFVNHFNYSGFKATRGVAKGTQVSINENGNDIIIEASYTDPSVKTCHTPVTQRL